MRNHIEFHGKLMAQGELSERFEVFTVVTEEYCLLICDIVYGRLNFFT